MSGVTGKTITITGAASGMGLETAKYLAIQGAKVSIADVQEEALRKVSSDIEDAGCQVVAAVVDVRDRAKVEEWIDMTVNAFGKIDGCANLAGVIGRQNNLAKIEEIDDTDWDFIQAVNIKGLLNCMRAQIPHMNGGGSIVNAASIAGLQGFKQNGAYVASKHAVIGLTRTAAKELGERRIRCNCFCPGIIDTPMLHQAARTRGNELKLDHIPLGRRGQPSDVAKLIEFLLSDNSSYITGTSQSIDGGWFC